MDAQVPGIINYQGRIISGGTNFDGTGQFQFALVNGMGAPTYWSNGVATVSLTVTKGLYSVLLGDTTIANMAAIPVTVFTNTDVRLRVWFNDGIHGAQQLTPDQRLAAAGYALMAANVPAGAITSAQLASNAVTSANLAPGAVTTAAIAGGAVGANQLASNAVSGATLAANGVLTNGSPTFTAGWAQGNPILSLTNSYIATIMMLSTNEWSIPQGSWNDINAAFICTSPDGTQLTWFGQQPLFGNGALASFGPVNDPDVWFATNGYWFGTYTFSDDTATNSNYYGIPSMPTNGFIILRATILSNNFAEVGTINCSSLAPYVTGATITNVWVQQPKMEVTLTTNPRNLFFDIATNYHGGWVAAMTTAQDPPNYTQWSTPVLVPIVGPIPNGWISPIGPCGLNWNGTNLLFFTTSNSLWLVTNTISAAGTYTVWKNGDWGHWTNAVSNGATITSVLDPRVVILPDRKRLVFECNNVYGTPLGVHYSDCFDDWQTWTPPTAFNSPLMVTNFFGTIYTNFTATGTVQPLILRMMSPLYIPSTFVVNSGITVNGSATFNGGINALNVFNGLTADSGTINGTLTVSNGATITSGTLVLGTVAPVGLSFYPMWWTNAGNNLLLRQDVLNFVDTSTGPQTDRLAGVQSPIYIVVTNATVSANPLVLKAGLSGSAQFLNNNGSYYTVSAPGIIIAIAPTPGAANRTLLLDGTAMVTNGASFVYSTQVMILGRMFTNQTGRAVQYVEQAVFNDSAAGRPVLRGSNITQGVGWDWSFPGGLNSNWTNTVTPIFASPNDQILYEDVSTGSGATITHYRLDAIQRP